MFSFPLAYALIPFLLVVLFAIVFLFFNLFHIRRYAIRSTGTTFLWLSYIVCFGLILGLFGSYLATIDWSREIQVNDLLPDYQSSSRL
ncbi:MAG: hypothetical protein WAZ14_01110 [Patescibacteria group bacterium]